MIIRSVRDEDKTDVANLIAKFRLEHKQIKGIKSTLKIEQAKEALDEYLESNFPVLVADKDNGSIIGYLVCRVDENVVWVESVYVEKDVRREGIALKLYKEAERISSELGGDTLYNWVLPNNDKIIKFLSNQGYNVLNMIEIRKPLKNEVLTERITVGNHEYVY